VEGPAGPRDKDNTHVERPEPRAPVPSTATARNPSTSARKSACVPARGLLAINRCRATGWCRVTPRPTRGRSSCGQRCAVDAAQRSLAAAHGPRHVPCLRRGSLAHRGRRPLSRLRSDGETGLPEVCFQAEGLRAGSLGSQGSLGRENLMVDQVSSVGTVPAERTPPLRRPWLHVLLVGLVLWIAATAVTVITSNTTLLPTVILLGSFLVPVVFVVWAYGRRSQYLDEHMFFRCFVTGRVLGVLGPRCWSRICSSRASSSTSGRVHRGVRQARRARLVRPRSASAHGAGRRAARRHGRLSASPRSRAPATRSTHCSASRAACRWARWCRPSCCAAC
jgi:hypothetical protein